MVSQSPIIVVFLKKYNSSDNLCDDNPYDKESYSGSAYAVSFMAVTIFEGCWKPRSYSL